MNKTTWLTHLLVLTLFSNSYAMEQKENPHGKWWGQMAGALGQLTTIEQRPIAKYGMHSRTTWLDAHKEAAYQQALASVDAVALLKDVAQPVKLKRSDIKNAKTITRTSVYTYPLAHFARAVLLLQEGNTYEAQHEFKEAERTVGQYNPHQTPIAHAASFSHFLLQNQHDSAFKQLTQLQALLPFYPSWQAVADIQRNMLVDVDHVPVIVQLADEGSASMQYRVLQEACKEALAEKKVTAQYGKVSSLAHYIESLDQQPEYNAYAQALRLYLTAGKLFEEKKQSLAAEKLIELLEQNNGDLVFEDIQQLARQLFESVASSGDFHARCYVVAPQLQSSKKKIRVKGLIATELLLQACIKSGDAVHVALLEQFGIIETLKQLAKKNNTRASILCGIWTCNQALACKPTGQNDAEIKALYQDVSKYLSIDRKGSSELELLDKIDLYATAVIAYYDNKLPVAAQCCIELHDGVKRKGLDLKLRSAASDLLSELASGGEWQARCWINHTACTQDGKTISRKAAQQCCQLAADFLDQVPKELFEGSCGAQLFSHVRTLADSGNEQAHYLASRFLFRIMHAQFSQRGLDCAHSGMLNPAFKHACAAQKNGNEQAKTFAKALMLYTSVQKFTQQALEEPDTSAQHKKYDRAVESCLELLTLDVPMQEKTLCRAFAHHQLSERAAGGNLTACAWYVGTLFDSGEHKDLEDALVICNQIFTGFMTYDFESITEEIWQAKLQPFLANNIIQRIENVVKTCKNPHIKARAVYMMGICHAIQSMILYEFLVYPQPPNKPYLLHTSLLYAQQAYELSLEPSGTPESTALYSRMVGTCCFMVGRFYLANNMAAQALEALQEGARLGNPYCMRLIAARELDKKPEDGKQITKSEFDTHIATLRKAYELGDVYAGEVLAQHYFEGKQNLFGCGHYLELDLQKAYVFAKGIGGSITKESKGVAITQASDVSQLVLQENDSHEQDSIPAGVFKEPVKPQLFTKNFSEGLAVIETTFEDMNSKNAQAILNDIGVYDALSTAAQQGNALSQYLLSKIYLHRAVHSAAIADDIELRRVCHTQALLMASKALHSQDNNVRFEKQFIQASVQTFTYFHTTLIDHYGYDQELFEYVMGLIEPIVSPQKELLHTMPAADSNKLMRAASQCAFAMACNGHVPALILYLEKYLDSKEKQQQDAALEALYRCAFVYDDLLGDALRECGIFDVFATHSEYIKQLADAKKNGHAALAMTVWLSMEQRAKIDTDESCMKVELKNAIDQASTYSEKAKNWGCPTGIYLWYKSKLFSNNPLSQAEFKQALKALEEIAVTQETAAELLMELYIGKRGKLPCGQQVAIDKARAKKIALTFKDKNSSALRILVLQAQVDKEYTKAVLYKIEILKRERCLPIGGLVEISQNCAVHNVYPPKAIEFLEAKRMEGNPEALHALGALAVHHKEFERGVSLLTQAIEVGTPLLGSAYMELAFAYIDANWSERNVAKALDHMERAMSLIVCNTHNQISATEGIQAFGMQVIQLLVVANTKQDIVLKTQAAHALEKILDTMQETQCFNQESVEWQLIMAATHCMVGSEYGVVMQHLDKALEMMKKDFSAINVRNVGACFTVLLGRMNVDLHKAELAHNQVLVLALKKQIALFKAKMKKSKVEILL